MINDVNIRVCELGVAEAARKAAKETYGPNFWNNDDGKTHIITDPPYSVRVAQGQVSKVDLPFVVDDSMRAALADLADFCGWTVFFSDFEGLGQWRDVFESENERRGRQLQAMRTGVWVKTGYKPQLSADRPANGAEAISIWWNQKNGKSSWSNGGKSAVWQHHTDTSGESLGHPTPKPLALMVDLVEAFTQPGDLVIDPFCGSGTTAVACLRTGRHFWGCDINPEYVATAKLRVEAERNGQSAKQQALGQVTLQELLRRENV